MSDKIFFICLLICTLVVVYCHGVASQGRLEHYASANFDEYTVMGSILSSEHS